MVPIVVIGEIPATAGDIVVVGRQFAIPMVNDYVGVRDSRKVVQQSPTARVFPEEQVIFKSLPCTFDGGRAFGPQPIDTRYLIGHVGRKSEAAKNRHVVPRVWV